MTFYCSISQILSWQLAESSWQKAIGSWQETDGNKQLAVGKKQFANNSWQNKSKCQPVPFHWPTFNTPTKVNCLDTGHE
jgi:hypothetical protein